MGEVEGEEGRGGGGGGRGRTGYPLVDRPMYGHTLFQGGKSSKHHYLLTDREIDRHTVDR